MNITISNVSMSHFISDKNNSESSETHSYQFYGYSALFGYAENISMENVELSNI